MSDAPSVQFLQARTKPQPHRSLTAVCTGGGAEWSHEQFRTMKALLRVGRERLRTLGIVAMCDDDDRLATREFLLSQLEHLRDILGLRARLADNRDAAPYANQRQHPPQ